MDLTFDDEEEAFRAECRAWLAANVPAAPLPSGDTADGFPGLPGWGAKSAAAVLDRYGHLEDIPASPGKWDITIRSGAKLAKILQDNLELAVLFRRIATVETEAPTIKNVDELEWTGPTDALAEMAERLDAPGLLVRARKQAKARAAG